MVGDRLTLDEAADRLGVSRRRVAALVQKGRIPAQRLGRQWVIPVRSLHAAENTMVRQPGRPPSQARSWSCIRSLAEGTDDRLTDLATLDMIRRKAHARARHLDLYVHPGVLRGLLDDPDVVLSGRAVASEYLPVDPDNEFDLYVRTSDVDALVDRYRARPSLDHPNVHLHVVDDNVWPFPRRSRHADLWTAWFDLADRRDRAADIVLEHLGMGRPRA